MHRTPENSLYSRLLYKNLSEEHQITVTYCIEWLDEYWAMPPLIKYFTDHGKEHCLRLVKLSDQFDWIIKNLSESECFSLLMGILFHDIGMQADVRVFPSLRKYMEDTYNIRFSEDDPKGLPSEAFQNEIRKHHHLLTAAMLELMYKEEFPNLFQREFPNQNLMLNGQGHRVEEEMMQNIIDICKYHSKVNVKELKNRGQDRIQLLAALLRLFDELDITEERISLFFPAFNYIPWENLRYWNIHQHIRCNVNPAKKLVSVRFCLSPRDQSKYNVVFLKVLKQLEEKNRNVLDVIRDRFTINFVIDDNSVYALDTMRDLPDEVIQPIINEFVSDKSLSEEILRATVKKMSEGEQKELFRLALQFGSRPFLQNGSRLQELLGNHLLTEHLNNETCLRPEIPKIVYPIVRETFKCALEQGDLELLSDFPLLDVELSLEYRKAQYEKIVDPILSTYENKKETLQKILLDLLKQIQTAGGNGFAARNLVVLLMAMEYDFEGFDLSGLNLDRVDFSRTGANRKWFDDIALQNVSFQNTTLRRSRFLEKMDQLRSCTFIDQEHFATGDALGEVRVWNMTLSETIHQAMGHCGSVWGLIYHKRSNCLISCAHDGKIISYSLNQNAGFQPLILAEKETWLTCLDYQEDLLVTAGGDGNIYFENLQTGASFFCSETYKQVTYHSIRFDYSGRFVLAGDNQGGLLLLKLNAERTDVDKTYRHYNIAAEMIRSIESHPHRSLFYISGGQKIIIVEAEAAQTLYLKIRHSFRAHERYIKKLLLLSDGMLLFSYANDGWVRLWKIDAPSNLKDDPSKKPDIESEFHRKDMYSSAAAISPDGRYLLGAVRNSLTLCLWDLHRTEELWVIKGYQNWLSSLCFLQKKNSFLTGSATGYVSLWSYDRKDEAVNVKNLYRHRHAVNPVAVSPDDCYLISGDSTVGGNIYIWNIRENRIVQKLSTEKGTGIRSLVFLDSLDGSYRFVSASYDNIVRQWTFNPSEKQCKLEILNTRFPGFLGSCAISGDRTLLAFSILSKSVSSLVAKGEPMNNELHDICVMKFKNAYRSDIIIPLGADRIQTLAFTQDGSMLACGDTLGKLYIISMNQPETNTKIKKVSTEHIGCVAFSFKGNLLACADGSGTVSLWDPAREQPLSQCKIPSGCQLHTVSFAPDNQSILTAGMDGEVYILPISSEKLGNPVPQHCIRPYEGLCLNGASLSRQRRDSLKKLGAKEIIEYE